MQNLKVYYISPVSLPLIHYIYTKLLKDEETDKLDKKVQRLKTKDKMCFL